jgi:hypothetical protein
MLKDKIKTNIQLKKKDKRILESTWLTHKTRESGHEIMITP